jgi:Ca2+-binding EF-hand superfamily protein
LSNTTHHGTKNKTDTTNKKSNKENATKLRYRDGDGYLDQDEFQLLMSNLGMPVTSEMAAKIVLALDIDGDGVINLRELELFYKTIMADTDESPREMAKDLFSIFDVDCSGEISSNEFVSALKAFNLGFSVEDMNAMTGKCKRVVW